MYQLINLSDFTPYKAISENINASKKLDMYIIEAQTTYLYDSMGHEFFYQLLEEMENSPVATEWDNLFNGVDYNETTHQRLIKFEGIKPALIYWAYARFIANANYTVTAHNFVIKKDEWSENASEKTIGRLIQQANEMGETYWNRVEKYLHDQRTLNPTWYEAWGQHHCHEGIKGRSSTQISAIGKNN